MKKLKILFYTSWFRPQIGVDMGTELIESFRRSSHELVGVVGPDEEKLRRDTEKLGIPYVAILPEFWMPSKRLKKKLTDDSELQTRFAAWLDQLKRLEPDLGILYFATWIPPEMMAIARHGFLNFHPAPLPEMRGFLPEDFALLWGMKKMCGTLHKVTEEIDEGPILLYSKKARLKKWDTPDMIMQRVGEMATDCILRGIDLLAQGKERWIEQAGIQGFRTDYGPFYPESFIRWDTDSHEMLHRRFLTFRGQNHRVCLKAEVQSQTVEILDMEWYRCRAPGRPGALLGKIGESLIVRTREGVAVIKEMIPFVRDSSLALHLDHTNERVIESGQRPKSFRLADLRKVWK